MDGSKALRLQIIHPHSYCQSEFGTRVLLRLTFTGTHLTICNYKLELIKLLPKLDPSTKPKRADSTATSTANADS